METQRAREESRELHVRLAELREAHDRASAFDRARNMRVVSPFQEKEVDKYFAHFEKLLIV